ncbi:MAG: helix-turn-helix transcriptional regulator [Jatrophihabitantaceae bacterium]
MPVRRADGDDLPSTDELLLGILTLLADDREQRVRNSSDQPRTELLLSSAGLSNEFIARALGKNPNAVRMLISRAKEKSAAPAKKSTKTAD